MKIEVLGRVNFWALLGLPVLVTQIVFADLTNKALYDSAQLIECPQKPSCVSTQSMMPEKVIVPFTFSADPSLVLIKLKEILATYPGFELVKEDGVYLHYEIKPRLLSFLPFLADDLEFVLDTQNKTVQFRSASRFGYSDWGLNRKRLEQIRNRILGQI